MDDAVRRITEKTASPELLLKVVQAKVAEWEQLLKEKKAVRVHNSMPSTTFLFNSIKSFYLFYYT